MYAFPEKDVHVLTKRRTSFLSNIHLKKERVNAASYETFLFERIEPVLNRSGSEGTDAAFTLSSPAGPGFDLLITFDANRK